MSVLQSFNSLCICAHIWLTALRLYSNQKCTITDTNSITVCGSLTLERRGAYIFWMTLEYKGDK